ncbi:MULTISPECIES: hypothetical protein [unclassified Flavobacterium]|jgi:uncharacterized membrane protein|uniref:hypothetical protein n=1 Tax=unclassified Flavobacterium TaxID=196869 RepID=UPI0025BDF5E1|nr:MULTISPECIES: hypothetical protein [unclassified Flavobacterium]
MNDAHLHLVVNHFPIIGTILGLGILIAGMILKNNSVKNTAYVLFIVAAVFAAFSMGTGDGAEDAVKNLPGVTKQFIHEHEEMAEKLAIILYVLGVISIGALFLSFKNHSKAKLVSYAALVVGVLAVFLAKEVGTTGGEVRHTEIRSDATQAVGTEHNAAGVEHGDEDKD